MTDMIVSGAGTTAVNGTYVEDGTSNSKPSYTKTGYLLFWSGSSQWRICAYPSYTVYYYAYNDDVATPDLVTNWAVNTGIGAAPVPTVTAASSGTTHEGEATLSSLSYLRTKKA